MNCYYLLAITGADPENLIFMEGDYTHILNVVNHTDAKEVAD